MAGKTKQEANLQRALDLQTKNYLKEIVVINVQRMNAEGALFWWTDEVLLVIFAGLLKQKLLSLPEPSILQVREIARICDEICKEEKIKCNIFSLLPGGEKVYEYEDTMRKAALRLLI